MTSQEMEALKKAVDNDDPNAMFVYSEIVRGTNPQEADKYVILAAQLGNPQACEKVGDMYLERGDYTRATHYFKIGAKAGLSDCSVKLAVLKMSWNETVALRELEELAEMGSKSACIALADYHKSNGNRKEAAFWRSLIK